MGIEHEQQWVFVCDTCGELEVLGAGTSRRYSIKEARKDGWKIGNKVTCPECANKKEDLNGR